MDYYRVFCPKSKVQDLPQSITVEETYHAFVVVSGPQDDVAKLRKRYPVEKLAKPPRRGVASGVVRSALANVEAASQKPRDFVVRLRKPAKRAWLKALDDLGAALLQSTGGSSVVVCCPNKKVLNEVQELEEVERVEPHVPIVRISKTFLRNLGQKATKKKIAEAAKSLARRKTRVSTGRNQALPGTLVASFFNEEDRDRAKKSLRRSGIRSTDAGRSRLVVELTSASNPLESLQAIAQRPGLKRLEEKKIMRSSNDVARLVIGEGVVNANPVTRRLTGRGEIVAVADTGIDTGDAVTVHADFRGRIADIQSFPITAGIAHLITNAGGDDGASDEFSGHGTHVAGSVLGNGARAQALGIPAIEGVAPEAELVFQAIEQRPKWNLTGILLWLRQGKQPPSSGLYGIPDNVADLFQDAFAEGARIHSNSWGGGDPGVYDSQCEDLDQFVWDHKNFLVVVAAGNSGTDTNPPDGTVDPTSVDSPGTAKNCLTVGASENNRAGEFAASYGQWWPNDYPVLPLNSDPMVDSVDDIVAFSSRGPCTTGRRKPDVIAPGTFVLSTRSSQIASNNFAWGAFTPAAQDYMFMGGTSMATPLVSGGAALVRQHLRTKEGISNPSAALMKAAIIHSTRYLDYRFAHPASAPFADNEQGWGRVELGTVLAAAEPAKVLFIDQTQGMETGDDREFSVKLTSGTVPFRVTLAYSDFPGEDLVNNLNLIVTDPDGDFHLGNDFSGSGTPDSVNNVEGVVVESPKRGSWSIRVVASEVLEGRQDFGLVISGGGLTQQ